MPKSGQKYIDSVRSCLIGDHFATDAVRCAAVGIMRPNTIIGIQTATKKAAPVRRAVIHALNTKTLTLKGTGSSLKFAVGDAVKALKNVTVDYHIAELDDGATPVVQSQEEQDFSITTPTVFNLGTVASVDHDNNKITFSGTAPTPALAENDVVYVADGSEVAVGISTNEINTDNETIDDNVRFAYHGLANIALINNYDAIAAADLKHIRFVTKEVD